VGYRFAGLIVLALLVSAYFYDRLLGIRAFGCAEVVVGVYWLKAGRIPYGWRGQAPAGYWTGWVVVALGALAIGIGLFFLAAPAVVEPLLCGRRGCT
jgi:hypothetical protein